MIYQIISPIQTTIEGNSFKEAIKNFAKVNYNYDINRLIITDQMNHYEARLNYYKNNNNKDKVGITVYPHNYQPIINSDGSTLGVTAPIGVGLGIRKISPAIKMSPIITAPGMISTTANGIAAPLTSVVSPAPFPSVPVVVSTNKDTNINLAAPIGIKFNY